MKKITSAKNKTVQAGKNTSRESCTIAECMGATGSWLRGAMIIFAGENFIESWCDAPLGDGYCIDVTPNGYITDETFYDWLVEKFDVCSKMRQVGEYRLLLLDGHTTHITIEVVEFCREEKILPFLTPPHLTHLVQPLDVGVFGPWKKYYTDAIDASFQSGCWKFDKMELLSVLDGFRKKTFKGSSIRSAWEKAGLFPFHPERVIELLKERVAPQTPPLPKEVLDNFTTLYTARSLHRMTQQLAAYPIGRQDHQHCLD
jgi:hypothetical protein